MTDATTTESYRRLEALVRPYDRVLVAYSGGVDSATLATAASRILGSHRVLCVLGDSPALPRRELAFAQAQAQDLGLNLRVLATEEMADANYTQNPTNRCFYCKTELFGKLLTLAEAEGFPVVFSGTNFDDLGDYRPGIQAGKSLGVVSPLVDAGYTKAAIRELAKALGVPAWDKPASPCLSSRFPYGTPIDAETLRMVEAAEDCLLARGYRTCRVRHHEGPGGKLARLEVMPDDLVGLMTRHREEIAEALRKIGYQHVTVDLAGFRSGGLNALLNPASMQSGIQP